MKYLILGAGPAGLSFANNLLMKGEKSFIVLEKSNEAGGLCKSKNIDESPLDVGGGHFLDTRIPKVNKFLFQFLPKEKWNLFTRNSKIEVHNQRINHPIEANIWQFNIHEQVEYLKSIAKAGCNIGEEEPEKFREWIYWKLGKKIANDYMIPYNEKMFSHNLDELGTYWLNKLPNVSFDETLLSCLEKKAYGKQPGHAHFLYPKESGYGELWIKMAERIKEKIIYNIDVKKIDVINRVINDLYEADIIINTIPYTDVDQWVGLPEKVLNNINQLKYNSIRIDYFNKNIDTDAHWIYYPDSRLSYHRILVRSNFCTKSKGYWTETNGERAHKDVGSFFTESNKYAYPLNTIDKPMIMKNLLTQLEKSRIYGLGRWGEWEHYNSDVTVERALNLVEEITGNR